MNILFLTSRFPTQEDHFTLEKELAYAFNSEDNNITVANILEKKNNKKSYTEILKNNIKIAHIKTGNLFNNVSFLEKKLTALSLPFIFPRTVKKLLKNQKFDLIVAYGPYLCGKSIIRPLKKYFNAKAILVQWDIFPQNAYDLGIIKNKLIFNYFKHQQKQMYKQYDLILCNSQGNINYLKEHFAFETLNKLYLFHNCETINKENIIKELSWPSAEQQVKDYSSNEFINKIKLKYNIPENKTTLIFGGNIGIPQALENIIHLAELSKDSNLFFIIIGQGTEANKIKNLAKGQSNIKFIDFLPSSEYEQLLSLTDYGIISLHQNFTVPNFPAKVTSYLKLGIPILACVDDAAYNDLGQFIEENQIGFRVKSKHIIGNNILEPGVEHILNKLSDPKTKNLLQNNTKKVFKRFFAIENNIKALFDKIKITINQ